jgi:hypothetical protein
MRSEWKRCTSASVNVASPLTRGLRFCASLSPGTAPTGPAAVPTSSALRVAARYGGARVVIPSHGDPGDASLRAPTVDRAHASLSPATPLRRASQLPVRDGATVTVCGVAARYNAMTPFGPSNAQWRPWVRLVGDEGPGLFVFPFESTTAADGAPVCLTGRYFHEYPLQPGDPPHTSRMGGAWLVDARVVDAGR